MSKQINLSISKQIIRSKSQGNFITGFEVKSFDLESKDDIDELEIILQQNLYSTNVWGNPNLEDARMGCTGSCEKKKYIGMYGIVIDVDEPGMTIEQAKATFQPFVYLRISSSSGFRCPLPG